MKVIHVMREQKFLLPVVDFYNQHFQNGEHSILYVNQTGKASLKRDVVTLPQDEIYLSNRFSMKEAKQLYRMIASYDYIVLHSMFISSGMKLLLSLKRSLLKKMVWIEWGYDLYSWRPEGSGIKTRLLTIINRKIRTDCNTFVGIFEPDCDFYREQFPDSKAKIFYAKYCGPKIPEEYLHYAPECRLEQTKQNGEPIYIQVGHQATSMLNHISVLEQLRRFSDENIMLFLPLNYGNQAYGDTVQQYAEEHFPGKVICLREMLPKTEYFALLKRVDIAIFDTPRQIALANINHLIFQNVKLYLSPEGVMYQYFLNHGVPVQNTASLSDCSFEALTEYVPPHDEESFRLYIRSLSNKQVHIDAWTKIYDELRNQLK